MKLSMFDADAFVRFAASAFALTAVIGVSNSSAQSAQDQMHQQQAAHAQSQNDQARRAQEAAQESYRSSQRNSDNGAGQVTTNARVPQNHGAMSWYRNGPDSTGYIFVQGLVSRLSAELEVEMQCERRNLQCDKNTRNIVTNAWLVVGTYQYPDYVRRVVGFGVTRAEAEGFVQEQCRERGTTCTIADAFNVTPHPRGSRFQPYRIVVR